MKRVALCLFLAGCAGPSSTYRVYVDSDFSQGERNVIQASLNDWTTKSNGLVTFQVDVVKTWGTQVPKHTIKVISSTQAVVSEACFEDAAGCTVKTKDESVADSSRIYLPMDRQFGGFFSSVVRHEIGHSLGLKHDESDPLMKKHIDDSSARVTCRDVNVLDALHGAPYSCSE